MGGMDRWQGKLARWEKKKHMGKRKRGNYSARKQLIWAVQLAHITAESGGRGVQQAGARCGK
jgi:hypothetical protein